MEQGGIGHSVNLATCPPEATENPLWNFLDSCLRVGENPQMHFRTLLALLALAGGCSVSPLLASGRPPPDAPEKKTSALPQPVAVKRFARDYGFGRIQVTETQIILQGQQHRVVLEKDSRRALVNGTLLWLNEPVTVHKGLWSLAPVDVENSFKPILRPADVLKTKGHRIIVLDPGHGGEDGGAVSPTGLLEKAVVLDISLRVRAHLAAAGHTVFLTRHQDQFLSLEERPRRARTWKADMFVSIHANSGNVATAKGAETFSLALPGHPSTNQAPGSRVDTITHPGNRHNGANLLLSHLIQKELVAGKFMDDRGVRHARFSVLKDAPAPAALVEVGFLSHQSEGLLLANAEHREKTARAIARGIDQYIREVRKAALVVEGE
jgi:N-acetylmuramoyl-L-alanine amidase